MDRRPTNHKQLIQLYSTESFLQGRTTHMPRALFFYQINKYVTA